VSNKAPIAAAVKLVKLPTSAVVVDAMVVARRNLIRIARTPELLVFATVQPVVFVLLFRYVFGGSIKVPGHELRRLPHPRHHRPNRRVRRHIHRRGPVPRHEQRHH